MSTQDIYIIETSTFEEARALKAFVKAMKLNFEVKKKINTSKEAQINLNSDELYEDLKEAAEEVRLHKQGKIKLKTADKLLNQL
jgi:hypothetical protein